MVSEKNDKKRRGLRPLVAGIVAAATLLSPCVAYAGEGGAGSGSGSGGGTGIGTGKVSWVYKDSWGAPTRENAVAAMSSIGVRNLGGAQSNQAIDQALNQANTECADRSKAEGLSSAQCRLVGLGFVHTPGSAGDYYTGANGTFNADVWKAAYNSSGIPNNTYTYQGAKYTTASRFNDGATSINALATREMNKAPVAVIAIVLNQAEPPVNYDLGVSTKANGTTTKAGDTRNVADTITTSRNGSPISENLTGTSTLRWTGVDGTTRKASKQFTIGNQASQNVSFSYKDMDASWKSWPAGRFAFDVSFAKQGRMKNAVALNGDKDANEQWSAPQLPPPSKTLTDAAGGQVTAPNGQIASGSLYTAHVKAHSSASEHFWLYDTIDVSSQQVVIGGTETDDPSKITVTDEDGKTVQAEISIDDGQTGKRIVKAHVVRPASGWYTLNVPQAAKPTGADYDIPDDSKACWQGDGKDCQTGNSEQVGKVTPKPDKVWVLDPDGALKADDPQRTNDKGSDNRTFVTGDAIGAVVNGRIPAHLLNPFTSYSIQDDWTASSQWIDWDHKDQVRVYVDGEDETANFDIAIDTAKHTTTATAKSVFLTRTALGTADRKVKLYIGGIVRKAPNADWAADQRKLTNKASETWNNETTGTNEPPVWVRNPKPDKVWSVDAAKAAQSSDPAWTNKASDDTKTFVQRDTFAVTVNGKLPGNLARKMTSYEIGDDFAKAAKYIDLDKASVELTIDGKDSTDRFDIHKEGTKVWASAKQPLLDTTYNTAADRAVRMTVEGAYLKGVLKAGEKVTMTNGGWEKWNDQEIPSNEPPVKEWSPNPDKSWIRLENGKWEAVIDPSESNKTGADTMKFLDGDQVGSVVNGTIANDLAKVNDITLTDDYAKADYLFDLTGDRSRIRVYEADSATDAKSSVADIINTGRDVTDRFDITVNGTKVTAKAHADYLAEQVGLKNPKQITLFLPGTVDFADGKGAAQVRKDFNKAAGDELTFCENPDGSKLANSGSEKVNDETQPTNEPYICGYVPPVKKKVVAEGSQGGGNQDANDKVVYPGQRVEYRLTTKPQLPADLAYDVVHVRDTDTYDQYLIPDKQTLEITDLATGDQLVTADPQMGVEGEYTAAWDDASHELTIAYSDKYVQEHWTKGSHPQVQVRFEGTVSEDAPTTVKVGNQWALTLNGSVTPSNIVEINPPKHDPSKKDTQSSAQGDPTVTIDGKTMLLGDAGNYTVTLDLKQKDNAYRVWRAGITDDYDEQYVSILPSDIEVLDQSGKDVTGRFNVQVRDGVAYVYAKTVDTFVPKTGRTIPGDPQPEDLAAYASASGHDPLNEPAIDQTLLGQEYQVVMPYKVVKVTDGYTVRNKAVQVTNDTKAETNEVSNPLKPVNPAKDVTVKVGGDSVNGKSVYEGRTFLYRLDSSVIPSDRAYPAVDKWSITDQLDVEHDQYTGQWAVYATRDLHRDGEIIAAKGAKLAGSGFDGSKFGGDLFTASADDQGVVTVEATEAYRKLVSADTAHENGWRAYIQCKRIKTADRVENRFTEHFNGKDLESNVVWTRTPDMTPSLHLEKYDAESGEKLGDRDDVKQALKMDGDSLEIAFKITNTSKVDPTTGEGAWFQAKDLKLTDGTIAGLGKVEDIRAPANWDTLVLKPGESVTVTGTLKGVTEGGHHTDRAKVTGTPLVECPVTDQLGDQSGRTEGDQSVDGDAGKAEGLKQVTVSGRTLCEDTTVDSNPDDWNGYRPKPLAITGAGIVPIVLAVLVAVGGGAGLLIASRRRAAKAPADTEGSEE